MTLASRRMGYIFPEPVYFPPLPSARPPSAVSTPSSSSMYSFNDSLFSAFPTPPPISPVLRRIKSTTLPSAVLAEDGELILRQDVLLAEHRRHTFQSPALRKMRSLKFDVSTKEKDNHPRRLARSLSMDFSALRTKALSKVQSTPVVGSSSFMDMGTCRESRIRRIFKHVFRR